MKRKSFSALILFAFLAVFSPGCFAGYGYGAVPEYYGGYAGYTRVPVYTAPHGAWGGGGWGYHGGGGSRGGERSFRSVGAGFHGGGSRGGGGRR